MRRAKIVATLGPATGSRTRIQQLVEAGLDVARLNLSHGSYEEHKQRLDYVRLAAENTGRAVGVLADLQGPKIRTGRFSGGPVELSRGDVFTITINEVDGNSQRVGTTYKGLPGDVRVGDFLLVDDGKVALRATEVTDTDVVTEVVVPGVISNNKGINLPGVAVSVPALSEKDERDLRWALQVGVDLIALSFVRDAKDIQRVHEIMDEEGVRRPVIAKVEKPQAVENLDEIIDTFDGVMVARGDLGVELPLEEVPIVQKEAIEKCRRQAKPVIVATQVLESMIENPRPTRAEASDCANAVLDGADAVMLSGETSVGAWPIETVKTMSRIIESTETHGLDRVPPLGTTPHTKGGVITKAAVEVGNDLNCSYLCNFTTTGDSAQRMSRMRPRLPIIAFTPDPVVRQQLALVWGVHTVRMPKPKHTDELAVQVDDALLTDSDLGTEGDLVVIAAGSPQGVPGSTNALRVHRLGDAHNGVAEIYTKLQQ